MSEFVFREIDPRNDEDMRKYFVLAEKLSKFLKNGASFDENQMRWARIRMGAIEYVDLSDWINRQLQPIEENAHEFVFVCQCDNKFVGYINFCDYHMVKSGKIIEDDTGAIHEIFVHQDYRKNHTIASNLLMLAVNKLLSKGKTKAVCSVQDDNPNKFLHFVIADGNIIDKEECTREDGSKTVDNTLLIDLINLQKMSGMEIAKKAAKLKRKQINQNKDNLII
ncbi:MAG: GNAT family N-acetyltransferase [Clostridia bacterium]|nr:GNAT family N-acetyltransferase [Clostridia bacterium]